MFVNKNRLQRLLKKLHDCYKSCRAQNRGYFWRWKKVVKFKTKTLPICGLQFGRGWRRRELYLCFRKKLSEELPQQLLQITMGRVIAENMTLFQWPKNENSKIDKCFGCSNATKLMFWSYGKVFKCLASNLNGKVWQQIFLHDPYNFWI